MDSRPTVIERAFDLARSGRMASVGDIRNTLRAEGYREEGQLFGRSITQQLMRLIAAAKTKMQD
jgi:hypothetical protein